MLVRTLVRLLTLAAALFIANDLLAVDNAGTSDTPQISAQQRYDTARQLMQGGRYLEAADTYRGVAESNDAAPALRAQALFASGLMQENARNYERAIDTYHEVERRFAGTEFARQAVDKAKTLEAGGLARGVEFRRRMDAAWDALIPAEALAEREGRRVARSDLQRAAGLLEDILRDFSDQPDAKSVALALGNAHMLLAQFGAAQEDFRRAITAAKEGQERAERGGPIDNFLLSTEQQLTEAIRAERRQRMTFGASITLATIGIGLLFLRPWRVDYGPMVRFGGQLAGATAILAILAAVTAYYLRTFVDDNSPLMEGQAWLLVAVPGITGQIVALTLVQGLRDVFGWNSWRRIGIAASVGAVAALATTICLINAFSLFPFLDSKL